MKSEKIDVLYSKKEIIRNGGGGTAAYILWLRTEDSDYSGFIFASPENYDRAKVERRFAQLGWHTE